MLRSLLILAALLFCTGQAYAQGRASGHNPMGDTDAPNAYENLQYGTAGTTVDMQRNAFSGNYELTSLMRSPRVFAENYRSILAFSSCIVSADPTSAANSLLDIDGGSEGIETLIANYRESCGVGAGVTVTFEMAEAALAEALLGIDTQVLEPRAMSVNVEEAERFSGLTPGAQVNFAMIGRCVAVYSPGIASTLLETRPGSKSEKRALRDLYTSTPECGLARAPDTVPAAYQRAAMATGLYRWINK